MSDKISPDEPETSAEARFLATASHEIRTPLNGILGTVSLLLETEMEPAQREYAEVIRQSGARLLDLLNNVLDYARLDNSDIELEADVFCPARLGGEVVELLSPRAHASNIDIAARNLCPDGVHFRGDSGRIRQILFNLVGNALKFTETGSVLLDVDIVDSALVYRVIDTGPGIAPESRDRLFEAFSQSGSADAYKDGGVGLGLAIVKRLTEMLGGKIDISGAVGVGTCFTVTLPLETIEVNENKASGELGGSCALIGLPLASQLSIAAALSDAGVTPLALPVTSTSLPASVDTLIIGADLPEKDVKRISALGRLLVVLRPEDRGAIGRFKELGSAGWLIRPLRAASIEQRIAVLRATGEAQDDEVEETGAGHVLIADDNPVNALIGRRALESSGFTVTVATTGREAVEVVKTMNPAPILVLMDLRMPVMDGFEATRLLRESGLSVPIVAVSAEINPEIEKRAMAAGASGVASKPLDADALRSLAISWTTGRHLRSGAA